MVEVYNITSSTKCTSWVYTEEIILNCSFNGRNVSG